MQEGLVFAAVVAFVLGYFGQNLQLCMLTFAVSTLLVALVSLATSYISRPAIFTVTAYSALQPQITVPPWGFYNKHKVEWLPASTGAQTAQQDASASVSQNASHIADSASGDKGKKTITVKTSITTQVN